MNNDIQKLKKELITKQLGNKFFNNPKEQFITFPENMTASEYRKWRKDNKLKKLLNQITDENRHEELIQDRQGKELI